jgi:hypothetical protein
MFRAWDASVRQAAGAPWPGASWQGSAPRRTAGQGAGGVRGPRPAPPRPLSRRAGRGQPGVARAVQVARVAVPVAVIVAVGAGALMLLTSRPGQTLAAQADQKTASRQGRSDAPPAAGNPASAAPAAFPGYPGQRGTVTVDSAAMAATGQVAVGNADGKPAIWHRNADGTWSLVSASLLAGYPAAGTGSLTGIAYGRAGWIAVGNDGSAAGSAPVAAASANGITWHAITGTALFGAPASGSVTRVSAVAAGPRGYVVAGQETQGRRRFAALWWSPDLRRWERAGNGGLDGRLAPSDAYGAAATADGFVAVGSHSRHPMIWMTATGLTWQARDFGRPGNASAATLVSAAAEGGKVVAAGNATLTRGGEFPFVMSSSDGGRDWSQILLPAPGGLGTVTAVTATATGFTAGGEAGPPGARHPVTWTSPDGLTWTVRPAGDGT